MRIRVAVLAAATLTLAACGEDECPAQPADVLSVPSCSMAANTTVTVEIPLCLQCDQVAPTCDPVIEGGVIQLDTRAEVCEAQTSCPLPSCGIDGADRRVVSCTFTSPPPDDYELLVLDGGSGQVISVPFSTMGSDTTCSG